MVCSIRQASRSAVWGSTPAATSWRGMNMEHKKVILLFTGTTWLRSWYFLFHQFFHGDKVHKIVGGADVLSALSATLVGGFNVDAFNKLS